MMLITVVSLAAVISGIDAFAPFTTSHNTFSTSRGTPLKNLLADEEAELGFKVGLEYVPGKADSELAKRFGDKAGNKIKTVGEAYSEFTELLGTPMNALYRNTVTDIVGTTHLTCVNARFQRDAIWSLGLMKSLDLLLKNYPERDTAKKIVSSLISTLGMKEEEIVAEAKLISDWVKGKTKDDVSNALKGEGDSPVAAIAKVAMADEYWMYSRNFGVGMIGMMEEVGVEMSMESSFNVMEEWMKIMGKPQFTACSDSDYYFRGKAKLDMMETLMKEVEIREKKRQAQRLEDRAEAVMKKAERDAEFKKEEDAAEASSS